MSERSQYRFALLTVASVAGIWFLQAAQEVFIPLMLAVLVSYVLEPLVSWLERVHVPRILGSAIVLIALCGVLALGMYYLKDDVIGIVEELPAAAGKLEQMFQSVAVVEKPLDLNRIIIWGSVGMLTVLYQAVLLLFLVYFFLASADLFRAKLARITSRTLAQRKITVEILREINTSIGRYVLVLAFTGTVVAAASALALHWIGLERAATWGIAAGVCNSIPYFGPLLVAVGLAVVAFLQFGTIEMALYVVLIATVITTLEGYLLTPLLIGKASHMNGVAVFVGLLFWSWLWGAWGMLLAAPMLVIVKSICDRVEDFKVIGELLGE